MKGSLHEYMEHECAKSSLAFRKPAVAAASRRPARADNGPKVSLDGPASLGAGRAVPVARWAGSATSAPEAERQCLSRLTIARCLYPPERRRPYLGHGLFNGGTQWMVLRTECGR